MGSSPGQITQLLTKVTQGDRDAQSTLVAIVYGQLRRLAAQNMRRERPGHTLQPTALVHETFLRLVQQRGINWQSRAHFFSIAAQTMRRLLVDHARAKYAKKRGGPEDRITLDEDAVLGDGNRQDFLYLNDALDRLSQLDPRQGQIVELRFFGGFSEEEIGEILRISARTVKREWTVARAWLYRELKS
jgi:RNA polymerase sigma-70 factor, ECF subfamily